MIPIHELLWFALAAFLMVISPGPNMIYLISRSITQGKTAGLVSLVGVISGFLFHIVLAGFGLTAILLAVPFAYGALKISGAIYLLHLAYQAINPNSKVTLISQNGLSEETYRQAEQLFNENQLAQIIVAVVTINAWNRIVISTRKTV